MDTDDSDGEPLTEEELREIFEEEEIQRFLKAFHSVRCLRVDFRDVADPTALYLMYGARLRRPAMWNWNVGGEYSIVS